MLKSTVVGLLAALSAALAAGCAEAPSLPPSAVKVEVAVPVPCRVPEPECRAPAFNAAVPQMEGDTKVRLLRAEAIEQADCIRRYKEALAACRTLP